MRFFILFLFFLAQAGVGHTAAIRLTELGTADMGVASAGSAAAARDAGTVYFNPAGMTRFDRPQLVVGTHVMGEDVQFSGSSKSLFRGGNGGQAGAILPSLGAYYIYSFCDWIKAGFSLNSPYGGMFNYGKTWKGRYIVQREFLPTLAFTPSVAFKVLPGLSVGAGFTTQYGYLLEAVALNPVVFGGTPIIDPDGRLELNMDSFAFGYNVGLLYEFSSCARVGITYRSKLVHRFRGITTITPTMTTLGVDTKFDFADFVIASAYYEFPCRLAFLFNLGWENWSVLKRTVLSSDNGGSFTIPRNWKDTWHGAIGLEYRLADPVLLQLGFSYDSSPTKASQRTPDLPVDRQLRFGTGLIFDCNCCEKLSFAFEYMNAGSAAINLKKAGTDITLLKGHYSHNNFFFLNASYIRSF